MNVPCTEETCPVAATAHKKYNLDLPRRFFEVNAQISGGFYASNVTALAGSSVMFVPADIDDDGRIDMLVQRCANATPTNPVGFCSITGIYNNVVFDSFFIKAMMLSQTNSDQQDMG